MKSQISKSINLTKSVQSFVPPELSNKRVWKPTTQEETTTYTMPFGGQTPKLVDVQVSVNKVIRS